MENFDNFIKEHSNPANRCYYYADYSKETQESLENVYKACFRFGLYSSQILYMLDEMLKPLEKITDLYEMLGGLDEK